MKKIKKDDIIALFFVILFILMPFIIVYQCIYTSDLEQQINNRDIIIKRLQSQNNIADRTNKSIKPNHSSIFYDDKAITIEDMIKYSNKLTTQIDKLIDENNKLYNRTNALKDSLKYYKIYFEISQKKFHHKYVVTKNAIGGNNYSFEENAISKNEYQKISNEYSKLIDEYNRNTTKMYEYKRVLDYYEISLDRNKKNTTPSLSPYYAPKLDSALMLLEMYRGKLKYDKKRHRWIIGNRGSIEFIDPANIRIGNIKDKKPAEKK